MNKSKLISTAGLGLAMTLTLSCSVEDPLNNIGNQIGQFGYCDYGPITQYGGGCFEMQNEDDCDWELGNLVNTCSGNPASSSSVVKNPNSSSSVFVPTEETFLGMGYDVIKSAYINRNDAVKHRNYPVLDQGKMFQDGIITNSSTYQENFQTVAGNNVKEVVVERSKKIGASIDGGIFFSGGIGGSFENVTNEGMKESIFFAKLNYYRYTEDHKINAATAQNLSKYLTEDFKSDLSGKSASQILDLYGTHVFIQYYKGGALEANYTYTGSNLTSSEAVRTAAGASFKTIGGVTIGGDVSTSTNTAEFEKADNLAFNYQAFGGNAIGAPSLPDLKAKFSNWAGTISGKEEICGIAAFNSLISIWDLARAGGNASKATELESEFKKRVSEQGLALPLARKYKTNIKTYSNSSTVTLKEGTVAEIEIYALGAGGGGQGGDYSTCTLFCVDNTGTGGAGGGGAATYVKLGRLGLKENESVSLDVTIGNGGAGGSYYYSGSGDEYSGDNGSKGGDTKVTYKSVTVTAEGGSGAGGNKTLTTGGKSGRKSSLPNSNFYMDGISVDGIDGTDGHWDNDLESKGGNAAKITGKGTLTSFGGGKGAVRPKGGASPVGPEAGGGGRGGYAQNNGTTGGKGLASIVVKYYIEE